MAIHNFNLRGISSTLMAALKEKAGEQNMSVNMLILNLIQQGVGHSGQIKKTAYHDLDSLAGTWTEKEASDFDKNIQPFEKIDKELW